MSAPNHVDSALEWLSGASDAGITAEGTIALAAIAQVHATLALVEVIREALADDVGEWQPEPLEPPAAHADASLWQEVTAATVWESGDLAREIPFDGSVGIVERASSDSFGNTVLHVRVLADPHEDSDDDGLPTAVWVVERNDLAPWRRKPKAAR